MSPIDVDGVSPGFSALEVKTLDRSLTAERNSVSAAAQISVNFSATTQGEAAVADSSVSLAESNAVFSGKGLGEMAGLEVSESKREQIAQAGYFSREEVTAFGGIQDPTVMAPRSSDRVRAQPNADDT
jgi:hypothetical protein